MLSDRADCGPAEAAWNTDHSGHQGTFAAEIRRSTDICYAEAAACMPSDGLVGMAAL